MCQHLTVALSLVPLKAHFIKSRLCAPSQHPSQRMILVQNSRCNAESPLERAGRLLDRFAVQVAKCLTRRLQLLLGPFVSIAQASIPDRLEILWYLRAMHRLLRRSQAQGCVLDFALIILETL